LDSANCFHKVEAKEVMPKTVSSNRFLVREMYVDA